MLKWITIIFCCLININTYAAENSSAFQVIALGTGGGELEDNLSSYLVTDNKSENWIALDAGSLCAAIKKFPESTFRNIKIAQHNQSLRQAFFENNIKAYLISHAHLDHISGLVMCSAKDSHKTILGISPTLEYLQQYIFNWKIWPNFGDAGVKPWLKQYHYQTVDSAEFTKVPQTNFTVKSFVLNHGSGYPSTAFLVENNGFYLLYLGDTGADSVEHSQALHTLWKNIAPLINQHKLKGIFIEASYPNSQPEKMLFGHLQPNLLTEELHNLAYLVNPNKPNIGLKNLKVFVTHIKNGLQQENNTTKIKQELEQENDLAVQYIFLRIGVLTQI